MKLVKKKKYPNLLLKLKKKKNLKKFPKQIRKLQPNTHLILEKPSKSPSLAFLRVNSLTIWPCENSNSIEYIM